MQLFSKRMTLAYVLDIKGVSTPPPPHFFRFSAVDYLPTPPPSCLSMSFTYNVYYDSIHIHIKWLAEAHGVGGGENLKKLFLFPYGFVL